LGPVPKNKTFGCMADGSCQDLCVTPGNTHERCVVEFLYGALAEDIITMPGAVMMDWTGWSSPVSIARQTKQEDSSGPSPAGLRHRLESCDICHACGLATVVSP
jgi:hypothetical protein